MNKNNVFSFRPNPKWYNIPKRIKYIKDEIKWAYQRATKGYCDYDLWDMDSWLINILPDALDEFSNTTHSYPHNSTYEEWQKTIREISAHFKNYNTDWDWGNPYNINKDPEKWKKAEKGHQDFIEEELHKGFVMLEKHFGNLWD